MIREYRVWEAGSTQGHYTRAKTPKEAARAIIGKTAHYPIHVLLWKSGKSFASFKLTLGAKRFAASKAADKYSRFGTKFYKKDL